MEINRSYYKKILFVFKYIGIQNKKFTLVLGMVLHHRNGHHRHHLLRPNRPVYLLPKLLNEFVVGLRQKCLPQKVQQLALECFKNLVFVI